MIYDFGYWEDGKWIWEFFLAEEYVIGNCSYLPNSLLLLVVWILWKCDRLIWKLENNGIFSIKSLYKCLLSSPCDLNLGMPFFCGWYCTAEKVENLIWLINHDRLCCKDWLCHLGIIPPDQNLCSRCGMVVESIHVFSFFVLPLGKCGPGFWSGGISFFVYLLLSLCFCWNRNLWYLKTFKKGFR